MKKFLAVTMALVLMLGMSVQAYGAMVSDSRDIYVGIRDSGKIEDSGERDNSVIGFTINWDEEDITALVEEKTTQGKKWDPDQKKYVDDPETLQTVYYGYNSQWEVTITNLSAVNVEVSADFEYAEGIEYQGWLDFNIGDRTLSAASEGQEGGKTTLRLDFYVGENDFATEIAKLIGDNERVKIGTLTISISAVE